MATQATTPHAKRTFRLRRKPRNPTGTMTIVEHVQELRRRLIMSALAIVAGTIIGFIWYQSSIPGLPTLGDLLKEPYCSLPPEMRPVLTADGECRLLATKPFEMFLLRMKVGALAGLVFSSPMWLYQIWAFITPGLHKNEKRATTIFVSIAVVLFVAGAVLAYFIVSVGLEFLLGVGSEAQVGVLTGDGYFSFLLGLLLIFGVSFEVPLILTMLNVVGVLHYDAVKDKRSAIIIFIFIFAAFMTPGQEPFSMFILAMALTILVEISLQFCRVNDKRRHRNRPDWLDVDDEQASALSSDPSGMDRGYRPEPIARPKPITPRDTGASRPSTTDFSDVL